MLNELIEQRADVLPGDFRSEVEDETLDALAEIGLDVQIQVVLVAFDLAGSHEYPILVEPLEGSLKAHHLAGVLDRAETLSRAEARRASKDGIRPRRDQARMNRARAAAVVEALEASGKFPGYRFFASRSSRIEDYAVHTCVGVKQSQFNDLPALDEPIGHSFYGENISLQHAVILECLRCADLTCSGEGTGGGFFVLEEAAEIVRRAAEGLVRGAVARATGRGYDVTGVVNALSSLNYERSQATGRIAIAKQERPDIQVTVGFSHSVSLSDSRTMRKLLELSDDSMCVLTDGKRAYGLGSYDPSPEIMELSVRSNAQWELGVGGLWLLRVSNGKATLPHPKVDFDRFDDVVGRILGTFARARIRAIVEAARDAGRGMTLVISSDPEEEARRLGAEAMVIEPQFLAPDSIAKLGRVDGAVLLGTNAKCHAFGVILDGEADGRGDRSRGSRFNSAVRYQKTQQKMGNQTVLIVLSVDGSVDIVPSLKPRIDRRAVEQAVSAYCSVCDSDGMDWRQYHRTRSAVERVEFYLNDEQCERLNASNGRVEYSGRSRRLKSALSRQFLPDAEMNDSYFL